MQIVTDRPKRVFFDTLSFRPAKVRHQNRLRAVFAQVIDRRQALAYARVIGDADLAAARLDRHIKIDSHQHAFPAHIKVAQREFRHN